MRGDARMTVAQELLKKPGRTMGRSLHGQGKGAKKASGITEKSQVKTGLRTRSSPTALGWGQGLRPLGLRAKETMAGGSWVLVLL